jgi:lipid A ethanolaminephosphotransferase
VNAYDNAIAYTDHVIAMQIDALRRAAPALDSVLIYASDHGESLGEAGIYLHGMPYAIAPRAQTEIPMLMWTSEAFRRRAGLEESCLRAQGRLKASHDNLYPTVLGIFGVHNSVYDANLDLLAACRPRTRP